MPSRNSYDGANKTLTRVMHRKEKIRNHTLCDEWYQSIGICQAVNLNQIINQFNAISDKFLWVIKKETANISAGGER